MSVYTLRGLAALEPVELRTKYGVHEVAGLLGSPEYGGDLERPVLVSLEDMRAEGGTSGNGRTVANVRGWVSLGEIAEIREDAEIVAAGIPADGLTGSWSVAVARLQAAGLLNGAGGMSALAENLHGARVHGGRLLAPVRFIRAGRAGWRAVRFSGMADVMRGHVADLHVSWCLSEWEDLPKSFDAPRVSILEIVREHAAELLEPAAVAAVVELHESRAARSAASDAAYKLKGARHNAYQALARLSEGGERVVEHRSTDAAMLGRAVRELLEDAEIRAAAVAALAEIEAGR